MPKVAAPQLVIVGGGGHARVVVDLFRSQAETYDLVGVTDPDPQARPIAGLPRLGGDEQLEKLKQAGVGFAFVALGDNALRCKVGARLRALAYDLPRAVSPAATVSPSAKLGRGVAVMAAAVINADARIGDLAIVNSGAIVEHDCQIGVGAHLAPGSVVAGGVTIGERTFLGAGAVVIPGVRIGSDVVVGAGACVIHDLEDGVVAVGVPAQVIKRSRGQA
jgi:UDP-perosamine 4-acetyltransferase